MKIEFDNALNETGWVMVHELRKYGDVNGHMFNNMKQCLKVAIEKYLEESEKEKPIPQTKEVEWVNGDACRYTHDVEHEYIYIGEHPHGDGHYVFSEEEGITYIANGYLLEPESEADKLEREELEAAYELYCEWHEFIGHDSIRHISTFKEDDSYALFRFFVASKKEFNLTEYRKGE